MTPLLLIISLRVKHGSRSWNCLCNRCLWLRRIMARYETPRERLYGPSHRPRPWLASFNHLINNYFFYSFGLWYFLNNCSLIDNIRKVKHLLELPKADTHLTLWKADLSVEGSFDEAVQGCTGVFHVATPMDFESKDPEVWFLTLQAWEMVIAPCQWRWQHFNFNF